MPLYTSLINKAKLGLATGFSVETVALFLCTEEVVCVHREGKKKNPKIPQYKILSLVRSTKDGASNFD